MSFASVVNKQLHAHQIVRKFTDALCYYMVEYVEFVILANNLYMLRSVSIS
jgi:hypothetical protein